MEMIARVAVVVEVPFDFNVVPLDPAANNDQGNEDAVMQSRQDAAAYAVSDVAPPTAALLDPAGTVIKVLVEEVREA